MSINPISLNNTHCAVHAIKTVQQQNNVAQTNSSYQKQELSFGNLFPDLMANKFANNSEKAMYTELSKSLSGQDKINFDILYKTGRLTSRTSNDGTSTLESLYKIANAPRILGLNNAKLLSETMERIANPFTINQKFGKLPDKVITESINEYNLKPQSNKKPNDPYRFEDCNVVNSASCVAASVEFNLADKNPAEYARLAEAFTSPQMAAYSKIPLSYINKDPKEALSYLQLFNVEYQTSNINPNEVTVKIAPDRDAIIRARVQNTKMNKKERNTIDVLMQSAFMQLGSQATYNSLTDKRYGSLNVNNTGLTEVEKTFLETIINNNGEKISVTYQDVDENSVIKGYNVPFDTVKSQLLKTLESGNSIIIGMTEFDRNNKILGGHEITIIDAKYDQNNELYFVCNDTDDNYVGPVIKYAKDLIPKIHHAGIPANILQAVPNQNTGLQLLEQYSQKYNNAA